MITEKKTVLGIKCFVICLPDWTTDTSPQFLMPVYFIIIQDRIRLQWRKALFWIADNVSFYLTTHGPNKTEKFQGPGVVHTINCFQMNDLLILHCKAILGRGQPGLMGWILLWIIDHQSSALPLYYGCPPLQLFSYPEHKDTGYHIQAHKTLSYWWYLWAFFPAFVFIILVVCFYNESCKKSWPSVAITKSGGLLLQCTSISIKKATSSTSIWPVHF